jgi:hypothetical protein
VYITYFEHLESLLAREQANGFKTAYLTAIRDAMIKDQHQLFHDAEFSDGCPICDSERETEG